MSARARSAPKRSLSDTTVAPDRSTSAAVPGDARPGHHQDGDAGQGGIAQYGPDDLAQERGGIEGALAGHHQLAAPEQVTEAQ